MFDFVILTILTYSMMLVNSSNTKEWYSLNSTHLPTCALKFWDIFMCGCYYVQTQRWSEVVFINRSHAFTQDSRNECCLIRGKCSVLGVPAGILITSSLKMQPPSPTHPPVCSRTPNKVTGVQDRIASLHLFVPAAVSRRPDESFSSKQRAGLLVSPGTHPESPYKDKRRQDFWTLPAPIQLLSAEGVSLENESESRILSPLFKSDSGSPLKSQTSPLFMRVLICWTDYCWWK